jgi:hypothetical protein
MKVIYIIGPFRGKTAWDIECNVRRAEEAALEVAQTGAMPLCPHTNSRFFQGQCNDEFWINGMLELLKRCDAVLLIRGWEKSEGSRGERCYALDHNIPIFYDVCDLGAWLRRNKTS